MGLVHGVLVATSQRLLLIVDQDVRVVHEGDGLYFGIAQLGGRTYVACHRQLIATPSVAELEAQSGCLLVLDEQLRPVDHVAPPDVSLRQPHGIAAIDDRIWVTCSYDDRLAIYHPEAGTWDQWVPGRGAGPPKSGHDDRFHYNAVAATDGGVRLLAHNYGRSQILDFTLPGLELATVAELGVGGHDLFEVDGAAALCSSQEGLIRSVDGVVRRVGGFPRGLAEVGDRTYVGMSTFAGRPDRHRTEAKVVCFDADWRIERIHHFPDHGQVLALHAVTVEHDLLASFPPAVTTSVRDGNGLEASSTAYRVPLPFPPLVWGEWFDGEIDQQWMAARRARVPVAVNPGERSLVVELVSHRSVPETVTVSFDGEVLGEVSWLVPGEATMAFDLPPEVAEATSATEAVVTFEVADLWQPDGDDRSIGVGLKSVSLSRRPAPGPPPAIAPPGARP